MRVIDHNNIFVSRGDRVRIWFVGGIGRCRCCRCNRDLIGLTAVPRLGMIGAASVCASSRAIILRSLNGCISRTRTKQYRTVRPKARYLPGNETFRIRRIHIRKQLKYKIRHLLSGKSAHLLFRHHMRQFHSKHADKKSAG
ncbi:hypothetical protein D3C77_422220 [compost metagenome]